MSLGYVDTGMTFITLRTSNCPSSASMYHVPSAADHAGWRYKYLSGPYRYGSSCIVGSWRQDRPRAVAGVAVRVCGLWVSAVRRTAVTLRLRVTVQRPCGLHTRAPSLSLI